ncbi:CAP domain-containing protein [Acetilactobacillus jinshanensis]|uniref:CAP domain-containing protein n=1 Tax=Acetilactobacillus jinshanensis TaxID=1720083 RepID=A0A4P6ZM33_9LACO|nr:CAP domain-containing protein [Acetilactobacillus jinshanensis]
MMIREWILHRIFEELVVLGLILCFGFTTNACSASRVHSYHYRVSRGISRKSPQKRSHKVSVTERNCYELYKQAIADVNRDRRHYKLPNLSVNQRLSYVGNVRSHQIQTHFSHYSRKHHIECQYLINRNHIRCHYFGENLASSPIGSVNTLAVGQCVTNLRPCAANYAPKNGYQLANAFNNASMYHDADDYDGHRDNILSRNFRQIGIGTSYDHHDQNYYIAMEFVG